MEEKTKENLPGKTPEKASERIIPRVIEEEMKQAYVDYAMSVIVGRALPDVRDGLKPVHRRILYAMHDMGMLYNKPFKKCARIVGECFAPGTLILTGRGLAPIESIQRREVVHTASGKGLVRELYEMPPQPLLEVTLENGIKVTATPKQKFKVLANNLNFVWKEAEKLTADDYLMIRADYPHLTKHAALGTYKKKKILLNDNVAYLLGQLLSDGWVEKGCKRGYPFCCGWCSTSKDIVIRIAAILKQEFGYAPTIEEKHQKQKLGNMPLLSKKIYTVRVNDSSLNELLVSVFSLQTAVAKTKEIPPQVFVSPEKVIFSLVSGLIDGDGSVHASRNTIYYGSISEKLIDQLQIILQHLGIMSVKRIKTELQNRIVLGRVVKSNNPFFYLKINGRFAMLLAKHLRLFDSVKAKRLVALRQSNALKISAFDEIPYVGINLFCELRKKHLGAGWYKDCAGKKFRVGIKYKTGTKIRYSKSLWEKHLGRMQILEWGISQKLKRIGSPLNQFIENVLENNLYFLKVKQKKITAAQKTYDLGIEQEHEFIAQGIVSHNCLGKYHPHGDIAVYDALVRMAQDFSLRYPLIKGQGNFGSIDGDSQAAMRYTEAKLNKLAEEMLQDLDKETVKWKPNFDGSLKEPEVLPAKVPNLLINGSAGIAVGMATNIPPHNLKEVCEGVIKVIEEPEVSGEELMKIIPGPDFPTGGEVIKGEGLKEAYNKGRGNILIKSVMEREGENLIVKEIPYMVNKAELIEQIADLIRDKKIKGIKNINDESDREGIRVVIELKKEADPEVVLNQLYKYSRLKVSFGINLLALVENEPRTLGLKEIIKYFIDYRKEIVRRRTQYDLEQAEKRVHILEGLIIALNNIEEVVPGIRGSRTVEEAEEFLRKRYNLTETQAKGILEMKLQRLASLEQEKIKRENQELKVKIEDYKGILASEKKISGIIKSELKELKENYGDERRTKIIAGGEGEEVEREELIEKEIVVVTITHEGYAKRIPLKAYRTQKRGGKGVRAAETKEEDFVEHLFITSSHSYLLLFTDRGQVYWLKVYELPEGGRTARGKHLANLLNLKEEKITAIVPVEGFGEGYLFMATEKGVVKKTSLGEFSRPRKGGIRALTIEEGDKLVGVERTDGRKQIILASRQGWAARFKESDVRAMGRTAKGIRGMRLRGGDRLVGMIVAEEGKSILTITEGGYGKRTAIEEYRLINRGGKGVTNIKITEKNGKVVAVMLVEGGEEIMLISKSGVAIRIKGKDISQIGRATQGVRIMKLEEGDSVVAAAKIVKEEEDEEKING